MLISKLKTTNVTPTGIQTNTLINIITELQEIFKPKQYAYLSKISSPQ